jgi:hypothetical protein
MISLFSQLGTKGGKIFLLNREIGRHYLVIVHL